MPKKPTISDLINDPDFHALSPEAQSKVFQSIAPKFDMSQLPGFNNVNANPGAGERMMSEFGRGFFGGEDRGLVNQMIPGGGAFNQASEGNLAGGVGSLGSDVVQTAIGAKLLKALGLTAAKEGQPILERLERVAEPLMKRNVTSKVTGDVAREVTKSPGRTLAGKYAGKGTTAIKERLAKTTTTNTAQSMMQMIAEKAPMSTLGLRGLAEFGPTMAAGGGRVGLANMIRALLASGTGTF